MAKKVSGLKRANYLEAGGAVELCQEQRGEGVASGGNIHNPTARGRGMKKIYIFQRKQHSTHQKGGGEGPRRGRKVDYYFKIKTASQCPIQGYRVESRGKRIGIRSVQTST